MTNFITFDFFQVEKRINVTVLFYLSLRKSEATVN